MARDCLVLTSPARALLLLALAGAACAPGSIEEPPAAGGRAGTSGAQPSAPPPAINPGMPTPTDPATPGTGGATAGTGGAAPPLTPSDAGAPDAGTDVPSAGMRCTVDFIALAPPRLTDVPAGETATFAVEARAREIELPRKQIWSWKVTFAGKPIGHQTRDQDPARIEFPTRDEGFYDLEATLQGVNPPCAGSKRINAIPPGRRIVNFLVRVTPPAGVALPILEDEVYVKSRENVAQTLQFKNLPVAIVRAEDETGAVLPAYFVRMAAAGRTARFEGYVDSALSPAGFAARLVRDHTAYQVLIVPDRVAGALPRAPMLFTEQGQNIQTVRFMLDPGHDVTGSVVTSAGPLPGARVRLRDGALPSTVGESDAAGMFRLKAREGQYEARVIPPAGSGLPEVQLPRSAGIAISGAGPAGPITFKYADRPPPVRLTLTVTRPDGTAPDRPMPVILETAPEALEAELADVGRFEIPGQTPVAAAGVVRRSREAVAGVVTFDQVPRARYRVTVNPPPELTGDNAITTTALDLSTASGTVQRTLPLARRGRIVGRLAPPASAAGHAVKAIDTAPDGVRRTVLVPVGADGRFELAADPGRAYWLFVEPSASGQLPRLALPVPIRATAGTVTVEHTLPETIAINGKILAGATPLPGAVVQVFCFGDAPACVDRNDADVAAVFPVDEALSDSNGNYRLEVPDPGAP